ncbi:acyl-CoA dehydrogenase family protein [Sphaerisporangium corydalis]|uniref:Acyl-CoA dehydrogenase family protein n=1 Tax=Sphaerisporangium corydalis TaxID=1441875 RepID=A0ABV9E5N6_9ACTN|nr:acyl-CoA dehydrogenase family protein [Sphaerisporangium corydalis]
MDLTEEQRELRDTVRAFLRAPRPPGEDMQERWRRFAAGLGVAGLAIPEEHGGAGCGMAEVAVVCEEIGRALSPLPYLSTVVLAAEAVKACGNEEAARRLLPAIAGGEATATVLLPGDAHLRLESGRLHGTAPYALDGEIVLAYVDGRLVEAVPTARRALTTLDPTRPLTELTFDGAPVRDLGDAGPAARVRDLGVAGLAAEQAGGAARCLDASVAHARARHQFGRPIGAFQAIKHKLADVLLLVESARSAAYAAARASGEELPVRAAIAGSYCTEAYLTAAGENIQVHGGVGVTWEHDAHLLFKRATSDAQLFGPPQAHRARLAATVFATP